VNVVNPGCHKPPILINFGEFMPPGDIEDGLLLALALGLPSSYILLLLWDLKLLASIASKIVTGNHGFFQRSGDGLGDVKFIPVEAHLN